MENRKKYWKCMMCGNVFYDILPSNPCPECNAPSSSAIEISHEEYNDLLKKNKT